MPLLTGLQYIYLPCQTITSECHQFAQSPVCESVDSFYCILGDRTEFDQESNGQSLKEHKKMLTHTEHCINKN